MINKITFIEFYKETQVSQAEYREILLMLRGSNKMFNNLAKKDSGF